MRSLSRPALVVVVVAVLALLPAFTTSFFISQIGSKALWLGIVAASLIFLSAYAGMISLAQTALAGASGFVIGYLTVLNSWSMWAAVAVAVPFAVGIAVIIGLVTVRTHGVYFFMLTLAVAIFLYYYAFQAQSLTGGFNGINGIQRPSVFGQSLSDTNAFYFFSLGVAFLSYLLLLYVKRTPFGIALQGIRDSRERMNALGFSVPLLRVGAFALAGLLAGVGGVLAAWYSGSISPGSIDFSRIVDVVVASVLGGIYRVEGAWVGAFVVVLLQNYVSNFTNSYNTVIGCAFVLVVLAFPEGIVGGVARGMDFLSVQLQKAGRLLAAR